MAFGNCQVVCGKERLLHLVGGLKMLCWSCDSVAGDRRGAERRGEDRRERDQGIVAARSLQVILTNLEKLGQLSSLNKGEHEFFDLMYSQALKSFDRIRASM